MAFVKGHRMAKAALELAVLDAWLRARDEPLAGYLGATRDRVPAGVSVGIMDSVPELLDAVAGYLDQGYLRIKLKIEPGWDLEPVAAVRERFGDDVLLQVDANAAYTAGRRRPPGRAGPVRAAADRAAAGRGRPGSATPSWPAAWPPRSASTSRSPRPRWRSTPSALGACRIVNVKAGRVGGYLEARRLHDACAGLGVPLWCGGMLETGIGRAANVALAALPGFTLPGDTSASDRYYRQDLTAPFVLSRRPPRGPARPRDRGRARRPRSWRS